MSIKVWSSKHK